MYFLFILALLFPSNRSFRFPGGKYLVFINTAVKRDYSNLEIRIVLRVHNRDSQIPLSRLFFF